jgi:PAS domain S-box-containing protein
VADFARLLLVEDDRNEARLLLAELDRQRDPSFEVETAANLADAREHLLKGGFDLVALDLGLPDSTGFETFERIRAASSGAPIIVLTGRDDPVLAGRALREGAYDVIVWRRGHAGDIATIVRSLTRAFERHRAGDHLAAIAELGRELAAARDVGHASELVASTLLRVFRAQRVSVFRFDAQAGCLRCDASASLLPGVPWTAVGLRPGEGVIGRAYTERQPLWSANVLLDGRFVLPDSLRARLEDDGATAMIALPLMVRGVALGVVAVGDAPGRTFGDDEIRTLSTFADQAAIALDNARLFDDASRRRQEAEELAALARALTESLDVATVAQRIVDSTLRLFRVRASSLRVLQADGSLCGVAWAGEPRDEQRPGHTLLPGHGLSARAVATGSAVWSPDVTADPDIVYDPDFREELARRGLRAVLAVPLRVKGRITGALSLVDQVARVFTAEEAAVLQTLADQAALALENARLYGEMERRRAEAEETARVARTLTESLDVAEVAQRVVNSVLPLFSAKFSRVALLDARGALRTLARGGSADDILGTQEALAPGTGTAGRTVIEGRPVWSPDVISDPAIVLEPVARQSLMATEHRAMLGVPLRVKGQIIGALTVRDRAGRQFSEAEIALLQTFADQAALALENARLYEETERRRRESEVITALVETINASLDVDVVLERVVAAARDLSGADFARIALRDPGTGAMVLRYSVGTRDETDAAHAVDAGKGLAGEVMVTGQPARSDDIRRDPRIRPEYLPVVEREGSVAAMAAPIRIAERVEGVILVDRRSRRPFGHHDEVVVLRLADHAAIAIQNARLFRAEAAARVAAEASETRYRGLFDGVPVGLLRTTPEGAVVDANAAAVQLLGYPDREALLRASTKLFYANADDRARWLAILERDGIVRNFEVEYRRPDGSVFWVRNTTRVVRDTHGAVVYYEGTIEDVTDFRRAGDDARKLEEQLRQGQKMEAVGRLAGGIAHDFNNLLTVIIGRSQLLLSQLRAEDPLRRDLDVIQKTAARTSGLTRQLLAFSRKQVMELKVLDLNAVVGNIITLLHRLIGEDVELVFEAGATRPQVKADGGQLEQVIANLALNARDAMPNGGRLRLQTRNVDLEWTAAATISLTAGPYVVLTVTDTGTGMDAQTVSRIFEPFFTTKPVGKGTGLGLATVYGIVTQSGGSITVESQPGVGTSFDIYLPATTDTPEPAENTDTPARAAGGTETVLLVEDEEEVRRLAREVLEAKGYTVLEARHPGEASVIAERHSGPIHVMVTDVVMPRMSGRALAEQLAPLRPEMQVLYISGYTDNAMLRHGVMEEGLPFLQKPFPPEALAAKVRTLLDAPPVR